MKFHGQLETVGTLVETYHLLAAGAALHTCYCWPDPLP